MNQNLLEKIHQVVILLPPPVLQRVINTLVNHSSSHEIMAQLGQLPNPKFRRAVAELLLTWQQESDWDRRSLAAALSSSAYSTAQVRQALQVELVWTGPESRLPVRRTDQVLLQIIREAKREITLISFAVYKVPEITQALIAALERGVALRLIAETPESGEIPYGITATFGPEIIERAQVLVWPIEQRPVDDRGRYGSLHIKGAITDQKHLFITSANLTEYALTLNMELGLLVRSEELAAQVTQQINRLIEQKILVPI